MKLKPFATKSNLLNFVGLLVITYLTVLLVQTIKRNNDLQQQISKLNTQITKLQDDQAELTYKISYYQTDEFKDKEARAKLGLQLPGESVIILPKAQTAVVTNEQPTQKAKATLSNPQLWMNFILGRSS
jgi:cell division protein FtsL